MQQSGPSCIFRWKLFALPKLCKNGSLAYFRGQKSCTECAFIAVRCATPLLWAAALAVDPKTPLNFKLNDSKVPQSCFSINIPKAKNFPGTEMFCECLSTAECFYIINKNHFFFFNKKQQQNTVQDNSILRTSHKVTPRLKLQLRLCK